MNLFLPLKNLFFPTPNAPSDHPNSPKELKPQTPSSNTFSDSEYEEAISASEPITNEKVLETCIQILQYTMPEKFNLEEVFHKNESAQNSRAGKSFHVKLKTKKAYVKLIRYLRKQDFFDKISPCYTWENGRAECVLYLTKSERAEKIECEAWGFGNKCGVLESTGGKPASKLQEMLAVNCLERKIVRLERKLQTCEPIAERFSESSSLCEEAENRFLWRDLSHLESYMTEKVQRKTRVKKEKGYVWKIFIF